MALTLTTPWGIYGHFRLPTRPKCTCPAIYSHGHAPLGREWKAKQALCNLYHKLVHGDKYA